MKFEIHAANPNLTFSALYRRTTHIGRDYVAALPLFLLFALSEQNTLNLLNLEFVSKEVVSTLVGSLGLMAVVPLTTLFASTLAHKHHRLGK